MSHLQIPVTEITGELGLLDRLTIFEGLTEDEIRIQAIYHFLERFGLLEGHFEQGKGF